MRYKSILIPTILIVTTLFVGGKRERKAYAEELKYEYVENNLNIKSEGYTSNVMYGTYGYRYYLDVPTILRRLGYNIIVYNMMRDGTHYLHVSKEGKQYIYNYMLQHRIKGNISSSQGTSVSTEQDVDVYFTSTNWVTEIINFTMYDYQPRKVNIEGFYIPLKPYFKNPKLSSSGEYKVTVNGEIIPTTEKEFDLPVGREIKVKLHKATVFVGVVRIKSDGYTKEFQRYYNDLSGTGLTVNAQNSSAITFNRNSITFNKEGNNLLKSRGSPITKSFNMR